MTPEPVGNNCLSGGLKVQVGSGTPNYLCEGGPQKYYVFIRGHFKSAVTATNKAAHDQAVNAGRRTATANGDERHLAFIGATDPQNFLAIDVWNNLAGLQAFLMDPQIAAAFGALFDAPPSITVMLAPPGYAIWGALGPRPNTYVLSVRGTLSGTAAGSQAGHNQIALGGQAASAALGDYVHLAFLKQGDLKSFQAIDHWENLNGLNTFLNDPNVQAAFGSIFSAAPTLDIYTATDFAQY